MDHKPPPEEASLAARLRLRLDPGAERPPDCEEIVEAASGEAVNSEAVNGEVEPRAPRPTGRFAEHAERLQSRFGLSHLNRWVLAAVAAVVAAAGLVVTVLAWPDSEPDTTAAVEPVEPEAAEPDTIVVSVAGAVAEPGIVEIEAGARVADAIDAAGGFTEAAEPGFLNLARVVADGDLVAVPDAESGMDGGDAGGGEASGMVNVNAASVSELDSLTGIGPVIAERIIAYREDNGGFQSVDELGEVPGIGPKLLDELREQVVL